MEQTFQSNRNVFYACHYHVVWCPKYRRKVLVKAVEVRLKQIIAEICREHTATPVDEQLFRVDYRGRAPGTGQPVH